VPSNSVYVGIDVACARGKRLPICVLSAGDVLIPTTIPPRLAALIPPGRGNKEIAEAEPFQKAAREVTSAIVRIEAEMGWHIERTAIDAPAAPPESGSRRSETELGRCGLSSFRTPPRPAWLEIKQQCRERLARNPRASTLPYANKIWMLFGFELFCCLRGCLRGEVIEVYPFSIVRELLPTCAHKSTEKGYQDQLAAVAARTGWGPSDLEKKLKEVVPGSRHDRLDAFMAAWVASLPRDRRRAYGDAQQPDDAIWVPLRRFPPPSFGLTSPAQRSSPAGFLREPQRASRRHPGGRFMARSWRLNRILRMNCWGETYGFGSGGFV
jgi:hypothetical protein